MHRVALILAACLLAACATQSPEDDAAARAALFAADEAKCKSYGLQPGNPAYDQCLTKLADQRSRQESADRAARLGGRPPPWATF